MVIRRTLARTGSDDIDASVTAGLVPFPHEIKLTHQGEPRTPAMAAGISDQWSIEEIVGLRDEAATKR